MNEIENGYITSRMNEIENGRWFECLKSLPVYETDVRDVQTMQALFFMKGQYPSWGYVQSISHNGD